MHEAWLTTAAKPKALPSVCGVSCGYIVEWLTGIELALSAWNLYCPGLSHSLTCGARYPRVTVRDRLSPGLMAR